MTNQPVPNSTYVTANGTFSTTPLIEHFDTRDPTPSDIQYAIQQRWWNKSLNNEWLLVGFSSSGGVVTAIWEPIGSASAIEDFTVDAFTPPGTNPVVPNGSHNITVTGGQVAAGTTTNVIQTNSLAANTYTIQVQRSQAVGISTIGDNGVSHFNSAQFSVDSNGFVSISGGSVAESFQVDAHTAPGTNPVLPNGSGIITITGGQVAAGTTSNVIQTNSLAANTYTIQVQRSQAVGSSTVGDNGVCHFNSSEFTVDSNGFVSIIPQALTITFVNHAASPYTVLTTDQYIAVDTTGGVVTIKLPNAPTTGRVIYIKDQKGTAATNNISVTTVGGAVTIDSLTTYTMVANFTALSLIFDGTSYEIF